MPLLVFVLMLCMGVGVSVVTDTYIVVDGIAVVCYVGYDTAAVVGVGVVLPVLTLMMMLLMLLILLFFFLLVVLLFMTILVLWVLMFLLFLLVLSIVAMVLLIPL